MGNTQTLNCTRGEKVSKAEKNEEKYTKTAPTEKTNGETPTDKKEEVVASSEVPAADAKPVDAGDKAAEPADTAVAEETAGRKCLLIICLL